MLRIFDPSTGVPMLAFGDRVLKFLGRFDVGFDYTGGQQSGYIEDARLTQYPGCEGFVYTTGNTLGGRTGTVILSISGNRVNWSYPFSNAERATRPNANVLYGIY